MADKVSTSTNFHIKYRPDIDGIRAIAVVLVLIFHAFPENLPGGFLGVDIFFVISGYLISSIILGGLRDGTYSLKSFYIKRINRIFPALILILIFSILLGWFGLIPEEYKELGRHTASAAFFVSNITLWHQSGYFDISSDLKPLLHLWSLAVEEQFYIFWPLVMSFCWKRQFNLIKVSYSIIIISFIINIFMSYNYQSGAFYSPMSRFWEILVGALLAFTKFEKVESQNRSIDNIQSVLGLCLITLGVVSVSKTSLFPGFWALCPVIGTCLLISASSDSWINRIFFSNKILVWIGLISYPLYLWHWPLISFSKVVSSEPLGTITKFILLGISFILAWLTYRCLELPLKTFNNQKRKPLILLFLLLLLGLVGAYIKGAKGIRSRDIETVNNYSNLSSVFTGISCEQFGLKMKTSSYCSKLRGKSILLVGDSHAPHLYFGLEKSGDEYFSKVAVMAGVTCNGLIKYYNDNNCTNYIASVLRALDENPSIKYVVLTGSHQSIQGTSSKEFKRYFDGYSNMLEVLLEKGVTPVFFIDNIALKRDPLKCVDSRLALRKKFSPIPQFCKDLKKEDIVPHDRYDAFISRLSMKFPNITFYDPRPLICENKKCSLFRKERLLYSDINHYSIYGSLIVGRDLVKQLNILKLNLDKMKK